jgi:NADPH:quinone reductase-like Zn-dependent oxidoreductase
VKALQYSEFGDAADVVHLVDIGEPAQPGEGEVLVEVLYSPLNFHDLLIIGGHAAPPTLPAVAGNEGLARVVATGPGVDGVRVGDVVVLPLLLGTWRERLIAPAAGLVGLPDGDLQQFSMLGSNTPTAGLALSEFVPLSVGDWVVQSSGNGGVGRNVIALAKARGLRTVSIVRRHEVVPELLAAGADVVLVHGANTADEIRKATGDAPIKLGIEGVGGEIAEAIVEVLDQDGTLVRYSASDEIDPKGVGAAKNLSFPFLFVGAFDYADKIAPVIAEALPLVQSGSLHVPVEAVFPLDDIDAAIGQLLRGGKVLLKVSE